MFPRWSHLLAPLTAQVGRRNLQWTPQYDQSFQAIKALLAKEAFLQYPDHNKPFRLYTDASDYQLGAVIMQNGKPVALFSRKLNQAQRHYTTGEKELLSIVATLNEYRTMLYGCRELRVHTDHKNLTFNNLQTKRVLRWRLFIEEFGHQFHYVKGSDNPVADALSRLSFSERQSSSNNIYPENPRDVLRPHGSSAAPVLDSLASFYTMVTDDPDLLDCFVHLPDQQDVPFQMDNCSSPSAGH
jgi:RNase H-like domain found in reverse transcriptase